MLLNKGEKKNPNPTAVFKKLQHVKFSFAYA